MPILKASPRSWTASEVIAMLPVIMPHMNSNIEKLAFRRNAINIFFSVLYAW
jgi:hypothetical protein